VAVIAWIVISVAYAFVLRERLPMRALLITAITVGSVVWLGCVLVTGARFAFRDWRARERLARGERPNDGDLVTAIGAIRPTLEPLVSPVSGRACVIYSYDIGPPSGGQTVTRDYSGFGMTRCTLYTPRGTFGLGSFPVLEGVPRSKGDRARATAYIASARFEAIDGFAAVKSLVMGLYRETPPIRKDWRIGEPTIDAERVEASERIIVPGDVVTVTGRYVSARNEIVSDLQEKGYLRLDKGERAMQEASLPWGAIRGVAGGLVLIAAVNGILWFVLLQMPR
jgi:hypothetical protein